MDQPANQPVRIERPQPPREGFVAWGNRVIPLGPDVVTRTRLDALLASEQTNEQLRSAIRHALASYGTTEARRLLEKVLEETR